VQSPTAIVGNSWIFSFDYLFVDKTGGADVDDSTLGAILNSVQVTRYAVPGSN